MNEPKRLLTQAQSPFASELLRAAAEEDMPPNLRLRMESYLVGAVGADFGLPYPQAGAAGGQGAPVGLNTAQALPGASGLKAAVWVKSGAALLAAGVLGGLGYLFAEQGPEAVSSGTQAARAPASAVVEAEQAAAIEAAGPGAGVDRAPVSNAHAPAARPGIMAAPAIVETARGIPLRAVGATLSEQEPPKAAARRGATDPQAAGQARDLDGELRLLDAARRAIVKGELAAARSYLADYQRKFPKGSLNQEAASLLERTGVTE